MSKLKDIKLVILDVDGTLTDGKIYYDNQGNEIKTFSVRDGLGIVETIKQEIVVAIITGRKSTIVERRARELGIKYVYQDVKEKAKVADELINRLKVNYHEVMYIGDDINDLQVMQKVGCRACPKDATIEVQSVCEIISSFCAGNGAVREILEQVLKEQGKWKIIIERHRGKA